ncbi:hypothetical protein [Acidianus sp. HS-5]|uniref:hypothetical protein n=1 Tax=Acidianus sp. HS-5 TaxID=2886040 RepID=UPI001F1C3FE4|nr:hypothetical protein [Acidianus sp. HS-5]
MKLILSLNKRTSIAVLFLLSIFSRLIGIPWIYQFMYFLFTLPDYSIQGFFLNLSMIVILSIMIVIFGITKSILILKNKMK